jgi:isocitrate lyase
MSTKNDAAAEGIVRPYTSAQVAKLRGNLRITHTLAERGARRFRELMDGEPYVNALGALSGNQAVQMVRAGLKAIYCSGWQVAADANLAGHTYPDQSLYPANSVPALVRRINQALRRADQIDASEGRDGTDWYAPIVADAEAGFGGPLNADELMLAMIEAGAAAVHFEDQLSSEKKCGHLGGKVLVARTDANSAKLLTSDIDPADREFCTGERTPEGFFRIGGGLDCAIARGLAYAPYADLLWCETSTPDIEEARRFAEAIHARYPGKLLAYNCSPSFNWRKHLSPDAIAGFQREIGAMGYRFQFVTLAGFHALNHSMYDLARAYARTGMSAYSALQEREFAAEADGYTATRHQHEVGTGYFDEVIQTISGGGSSTAALKDSTEAQQFHGTGSDEH